MSILLDIDKKEQSDIIEKLSYMSDAADSNVELQKFANKLLIPYVSLPVADDNVVLSTTNQVVAVPLEVPKDEPIHPSSSDDKSTSTNIPPTTKSVLIALQKAQAKIAAATSKEKQEMKVQELQYRQILAASTNLLVPKLPEPLAANSVARWFEDVCFNLQASPWNMDGTSIYDLQNSALDPEDDMNMDYKLHNKQLSKHLYTRLREAK